MPHNLYLTVKYDAHINVEVCNTIGAVKYIFKYVYKGNFIFHFVSETIYLFYLIKGSDKVEFSIQTPKETDQSGTTIKENKYDEINRFQEARYISASEACWRIFNFPLHSQDPQTERLPVHLENLQNVTFKEGVLVTNLVELNADTQLTQFFKLNSTLPDARDICYWEMPQYYSWNVSKKTWKKRNT